LEAHFTDATVEERTDSKSRRAITTLSLSGVYVSTNKCAGNVGSSYIFELNCDVKLQMFDFLVVPLLHSVSDVKLKLCARQKGIWESDMQLHSFFNSAAEESG